MGTVTFTVTDAQGNTATRTAEVNVAGSTLGSRFGGISEPLARSSNSRGEAELHRWAGEAKDLGMGWVRADYPVRAVSPSRGTYNYAMAELWLGNAIEHGLKPLPIVYMLPQWMNGSTNDKAPPTSAQEFADWCGHVAPHWEDVGVEWVEIWNEQNLSGFWPNPDRVRYADLFARTADAIHSASNVKVLTGGISTADTQYQAGVKGVPGYTSSFPGCYCTLDCYGFLGALAHADGIGFHPYLDGVDPIPGGASDGWCRWTGASVRQAIGICDKWAPTRRLSVWNTESAAPRISMSEAEQAKRAGHAFEAFDTWTLADGSSMRDRLGPYFWFTLRDWNDASEARARTFGLMDPAWVPHQAYGTVQEVLARTIP